MIEFLSNNAWILIITGTIGLSLAWKHLRKKDKVTYERSQKTIVGLFSILFLICSLLGIALVIVSATKIDYMDILIPAAMIFFAAVFIWLFKFAKKCPNCGEYNFKSRKYCFKCKKLLEK